MKLKIYTFIMCCFLTKVGIAQNQGESLRINDEEYLEMRGLNVMLAHDFYPESHQGGVGIIQNGIRVATNGDLRLEPTPGQWQPVPKVGERVVDREKNIISVKMAYPDEAKNRKGFNPIEYPDLEFSYNLKIIPQGKSFKIVVDLDEALPQEWIGKVGMNIEFFPGYLFGKSYYMDNEFGLFNRQANGPGSYDEDDEYQIKPMAAGKELVIAPGTPRQTLKIENLKENNLELIDGRAQHSNGWFVVRSLVPSGATKNAIEWLITPNTLEDYTYDPVVQISQVGYHPAQEKIAVIETDKNDTNLKEAKLLRINNEGGFTEVLSENPSNWGEFLRYKYYQLDFTKIEEPGMYVVKYGDYTTEAFQISKDVYKREVWQPTLEYFLPVQMCHMLVNDRYKIWHGRCHLDDARMAPVDTNHFDGYLQGPGTLTNFQPGEHVPGLDAGGWHDAGDYDLRIESQASTIHGLSHIYEIFQEDYDNTTINQETKTVDILQPDGKPDFLQQIEHGTIHIVNGYKSLGRFYRGVIVPTLDQYVLLGDPVNHSDGEIYKETSTSKEIPLGREGAPDDRWVFTEENPRRELQSAAALAATYRSLKDFNPELAEDALEIAKKTWETTSTDNPVHKLSLSVELFRSTSNAKYEDFIKENAKIFADNIAQTGWVLAPVFDEIQDENFRNKIKASVEDYYQEVEKLGAQTPYGMPYEPDIWGAGWGIQNFGMKQYFLHTAFPEIFPKKYMLNALNFVLGTHPGVNTSSFASGVGSRSLTQAYGMNRGDFSFTPGGIGSGTALIRPDFPELLEWPFLWQQTEYVLGGGTTDYLFLVLAADKLLNK
ncbi:MAG: glycoside hydrolase family 9 protein [Zunongwangia sp.]|uniref:glycoside hydrolase family 9 protein n=1 Tax=Zunongwangia sp. TaxID=1965325 RepID=UPI003242EB0B